MITLSSYGKPYGEPFRRLHSVFVTGMLTLLSVSAARAEKVEEHVLRRGTPDIESTVVLNYNADGFQQCGPLYTAAAGSTLLLKTVTGSFNVPPGGFGGVQLVVTLLGGKTSYLDVPMPKTAPALQVTGPYDQYAGSLELPGLPVIALQACVVGIKAALSLEAIGYVVAAS